MYRALKPCQANRSPLPPLPFGEASLSYCKCFFEPRLYSVDKQSSISFNKEMCGLLPVPYCLNQTSRCPEFDFARSLSLQYSVLLTYCSTCSAHNGSSCFSWY